MKKTKDIVQAEAREALRLNNGVGTLLMGTGTGKSRVGVLEICHELDNFDFTSYRPPLIIVPSRKLRDKNWEEEFVKWEKGEEFKKIERSCYVSINKRSGGKYRLVVLDEAHKITPENYKFFQNNIVERVIALTATRPKDKKKRELLDSLAPVVYTYNLDQAVQDGIVAPFNIHIIWTTLDDIRRYIKTGNAKKSWYTTEQKQFDYLTSVIENNKGKIKSWREDNQEISPYISNYQREKSEKRGDDYLKNFSEDNQKEILKKYKEFSYLESQLLIKTMERIRFIGGLESKEIIVEDLITRLLLEENRFLVFCASIAQTEKLCNGYTFHSETNSEAFNAFVAGEIDYLAVVDGINEGINFPFIDSAVANKLNNNDINFIQRLGRIVRFREGHRARFFIVAVKGTSEEDAVKSSLKTFDETNIHHHTILNYHKIFSIEDEVEEN